MKLEKLAVLPQRRHRGYGRALLDHARHTAAKWDGIRLTADIIEENAQLKSWYLQNGFFYTGGRSFDHLPFSVGYVEAPVLPAHLRHRGTVELNTSRLILRQLRPDDYLDMFHNWASDPQVSRFLGWKTHTDLLETHTILTQWMPHYQEPQYYHWAMVYEGHPIGAISVHSIDGENKSCELGYCIGRDYWGRGLTAEAVKEVVGFLFTRVGFWRVGGRHDLLNPASGRVMEKAGMVREGVLRQSKAYKDGRMGDMAVYSILRPDWMGMQ